MSKKKPKLTKRVYRWYQQILILNDPDPYLIPRYLWSNNKPHNTIGHAACIFAIRWQSRSGIDIKKLQKIVINSKDPYAAYDFAKYVKDANVKRLGEVIISNGDAELMRAFADNVHGAKASRLHEYANLHDTFFS